MSEGNGTVGLSSEQTEASVATSEKRERGTVTNNPTLVAAAQIDKILCGIKDPGQRGRVLALVNAEHGN